MDRYGNQMVSRVDAEGGYDVKAQCNLPQWCAGCSDFDLDASWIFSGADPAGVTVSCSHYDLCAGAVRRAHCDSIKFVRVTDCPPPPGKMVLVAMSRNDLWYPRWAKYIDGHWEIVVRPGSAVCLSDYDLDWWMPLEPPPGLSPAEEPGDKGGATYE